VVGERRRAHIDRVAALLDRWARAMRVSSAERARWLRAAYLHDAVRDLPAKELRRLVPEPGLPPALLHGPAAAVLAARHGETDSGVLDAVRYHTLGHAGWDRVGRMLYLADYLEPGRPNQSSRHRSLIRRVPTDPDGVLRAVAGDRIAWTIAARRPLHPETAAFWNALVR